MQAGPLDCRTAGGVTAERADCRVLMYQCLVEYIETVTTPGAAVELETTSAWMRTPYGVEFLNRRSVAPEAKVASRPAGYRPS